MGKTFAAKCVQSVSRQLPSMQPPAAGANLFAGLPPLPFQLQPGYKPSFVQRAKLVLPHVGLVILSIFYTFLGGTMFYFIEAPHEEKRKKLGLWEIWSTRLNISEDLWLVSQTKGKGDWQAELADSLDNLTEVLFRAYSQNFITIEDIANNETVPMWTFPAALFFSATLITTIGYGHLVPSTFLGRVMCVLFGLLGIPLILVTVADMGKFLAEYVVSVYGRYQDCLGWCWDKLKSSIFGCLRISESVLSGLRIRRPDRDTQSELDPDFQAFDVDEPKVPVLFVLLIWIGYTAIGAVVLRVWEDWSFFDSFYYCFITVTTIGFGDIIPERQSHLLATLLFILTGLIITTMCIDLVGSQYIRKVHYFGRNIKKARYAIMTIGDKMVHMGEVIRYVAFLQKKYGLTEDEIAKLSTVPEEFLLQCLLAGRPVPPHLRGLFPRPFVPREWHLLKWIDSRNTNSYTSEKALASQDSSEIASCCTTARSPRYWESALPTTRSTDRSWNEAC